GVARAARKLDQPHQRGLEGEPADACRHRGEQKGDAGHAQLHRPKNQSTPAGEKWVESQWPKKRTSAAPAASQGPKGRLVLPGTQSTSSPVSSTGSSGIGCRKRP